MKAKKFVVLLLLPLLVACFLSVGYSQGQPNILGYSVVGESSTVQGATYITYKFTLPVHGVVSSFHIFTGAGGTGNVKIGIYNSTYDAVYLDNVGLEQEMDDWTTFSGLSIDLPAGDYWLGANALNLNFSYDSGDNIGLYKNLAGGDMPDSISDGGALNFKISVYCVYSEYVAPSPSPSPSPTPVLEGDLSDTQWFAGAVIFILVIFNIVLFMLPFALMRFIFGVVSLAICGLALAYAVPFSPYLQLLGLLVSVLSMYFASRARE